MKIRRKQLTALGIAACMTVMYLPGCSRQARLENSTAADAQETARTEEDAAGDNTDSEDSESPADTAGISAAGIQAEYDDEDLDASWDEKDAVVISCDGDNISIDGKGVEEKDGVITITAAGTYVFSGEVSDGQIRVDAGKEDIVRIVLNGFSITCADGSALYGKKSEKIILTLVEGTENVLADGEDYKLEDGEDEPDAAFFSKDDITINGEGKLTVNGNYQDGIRSKDDLKIVSGTIEVTAVADGIKGKDSIAVKDGTITVTAGNDGMKSNNDKEADKGYVVLDGGTLNITSGNDGVQAETILQVNGGNIEIEAGGGSSQAVAKTTEGFGGMGGRMNGMLGRGQWSEKGGMPEMPSDGEVPEMPSDGEMPDMPFGGEAPEMGGDGEMPDMPSNGEAPDKAEDGEMPDMPSNGDAPEMGSNGEMPDMPSNGDAPEMGSNGEMPDMPSDGEVPETGEDGKMPEMPSGGDVLEMDQDGKAADSAQAGSTETESDSMKALKGGTAVIVTGGEIKVDSADDALHSNGDVTVLSGTLDLATGDDGIHADGALRIDGGTITVSQSYEGLEGFTIDINGGTIHVVSSDDGLNSAGGSDSGEGSDFMAGGFGGGMGGNQAIEGCYIRITDGLVYVDASGDGLDSNGDLYVDGGTVLVCGPTSGADGALDYNGAGAITGGTVVAVGSAGMAQGFSDSSTQSSMLVYFDETQAAGTTLSLTDENGNTIFSFTPGKEYQTAVISTPELNDGQTYDIYSGTSAEGEENEGYISGGIFSGGEKLLSVTIDGVATSNRSTAAGNMGGSGQGRNGAWGKDKAKNNR